MISQEIQNFVKQQIQAANSANRFQLSSIPRHIHNGVDSPLVFLPTIIISGKVLSSGESSVPFPSGFAITHVTTGEYFIQTNLPENTYTVFITPAGSIGSPDFPAWFVETVENGTFGTGFYVLFSDGSPVDTDFYFLIQNITNKNTSAIVYATT